MRMYRRHQDYYLNKMREEISFVIARNSFYGRRHVLEDKVAHRFETESYSEFSDSYQGFVSYLISI